jgi:hypothetical protein
MAPGRGRLHENHVIKNEIKPYILKSGIIYGANASGKSNLIRAINFAKNLIVEGIKPDKNILRNYFKLDEENATLPTKFEFILKHKERVFRYGFTFNSKCIQEEWLYELLKTTEKSLFNRETISDTKTEVKYGIKFRNKKEKMRFEIMGENTRANQLFLNKTRYENEKEYFNIPYEWFGDVLTIIFPKTKPFNIVLYMYNDKKLCQQFIPLFKYFDLGIEGIETEKTDIKKEGSYLPPEILEEMSKSAKSNEVFVFDNENTILLRDEQGELKFLELYTNHKKKNKNETVKFKLQEESDGTQRMFDLIPALLMLKQGNKVILVDEIGRSLHPHLSYGFFKFFFEETAGKNSQLIATTHDVHLLNLDLFRKDEIWFIEKNKFGESEVYSLEEFKPRYDKDIQNGYLSGRFGAIPIIYSPKDLGWLK